MIPSPRPSNGGSSALTTSPVRAFVTTIRNEAQPLASHGSCPWIEYKNGWAAAGTAATIAARTNQKSRTTFMATSLLCTNAVAGDRRGNRVRFLGRRGTQQGAELVAFD